MAEPTDPVAEAMAVLLGRGAPALLGPAVLGGVRLTDLRSRQVLFRPRRRVTITYEAMAEWRDGFRRREVIVASVDPGRPAPDVPRVPAGALEAAVWRAPDDPYLPGLGIALDPAAGEPLLREAGVGAVGASALLRAYRPGRRAVVELQPKRLERPKLVFSAASGQVKRAAPRPAEGLFLKVLRPGSAGEVARIHERLGRVVRVAPCALAGGPGILRLGALGGATLGTALRAGRPAPPPPDALLGVLDRVAGVDLGAEPGTRSDERLHGYVELLGALLPREAARLGRLEAAFSGAVAQEPVTVHGDFHEGNVLVDGGGVTGLLDVDGAGPGERVDDLGLLVGRVWSLSERAGDPALRYARALLRRFDDVVDPVELRRRAGVALVGRATGPFRNQTQGWRDLTRARLDLAERWAAD